MFSIGSSSDDSLAASLMLALLAMLSADSFAVDWLAASLMDQLAASLMLALLAMLSAVSFAVDRLAASLMLALLAMLFADAFAVDRLAASLMLALLTIRLATSLMIHFHRRRHCRSRLHFLNLCHSGNFYLVSPMMHSLEDFTVHKLFDTLHHFQRAFLCHKKTQLHNSFKWWNIHPK